MGRHRSRRPPRVVAGALPALALSPISKEDSLSPPSPPPAAARGFAARGRSAGQGPPVKKARSRSPGPRSAEPRPAHRTLESRGSASSGLPGSKTTREQALSVGTGPGISDRVDVSSVEGSHPAARGRSASHAAEAALRKGSSWARSAPGTPGEGEHSHRQIGAGHSYRWGPGPRHTEDWRSRQQARAPASTSPKQEKRLGCRSQRLGA